MYGSETWTLRKEDIKRLEALEMLIRRRMERFSWIELKTSEEVLQNNGRRNQVTYTNNPKPTEKLTGPHNESRPPSKNYN